MESETDEEIKALMLIYETLKPFNPKARARILRWVESRLSWDDHQLKLTQEAKP